MALWMVRGDKYGQHHNMALEKGIAYHGSRVSDLSKATSRKAILELLRSIVPDAKENQLKNWANQLYALAHRIKKDDLVPYLP